jgi:hypothetical protein
MSNEEAFRDEDTKERPEFEIKSFGDKKAGFNKPELIASAVNNCFIKRAAEMRTGYKTHVTDKFGNIFVKIIPDTRKEFIGAVIGLTSLLKFELLSKPKYKSKYLNFNKRSNEIKEKYIYHERRFEQQRDDKGNELIDNDGNFVIKTFLIKDGRRWIPEQTDLLPSPVTIKLVNNKGHIIQRKLEIKNFQGVWEYEINSYWNEIQELCDEWFGDLNQLISDGLKNYSKGGTM